MPYDEILAVVEIIKWPLTLVIVAAILRRELKGRAGE